MAANPKSLLIVVEGSDGAGKTTQFNLLHERLKAAGYDVAVFDFPRYDEQSSHFVREYLGGKYGKAEEVSPYTASLFYALDRYEASRHIKGAMRDGKIVLIDRYVGSNMAHQGSKFDDPVEQRGFFVWNDNLEYQLLGIPRPDFNFFLRVPVQTSSRLIAERSRKTGIEPDIHEISTDHLKKTLATYDLLCRLFPKDFQTIECTKGGRLLPIAEINNLLWDKLKPALPAERPHPGHSAVVTLSSAPAKPASTDQSSDGKLIQKFSKASLFLKISVERSVRAVEPPGLGVWSDANYRYYTPMGMPKPLESAYKQSMDRLADLHRQMRLKMEAYYERTLGGGGQPPDISSLLLPATPLAALCSFQAELSQKSLQRLAGSLLSSDLQELQWSAKQLFAAAKQKWPREFRQPLEAAENPGPANNAISQLSDERLSLNSTDGQTVKLSEILPRQEFSLLAESIYPYSSLSLEEINDEVSGWSYQQKYDSLKKAAADPAIVSKVQYKFDMVTDQLVMAEIISRAALSGIRTQQPSPRFGYEVPEALESAGIDDLFLECFDESLKLFSLLQKAEREDLTVYASLLGHRQRWQFGADAATVWQVLSGAAAGRYAKVAEAMMESVSEVHPLIWEIIAGDESAPAARPPAKKVNRVKPSKRRRPKPKKP